jgi:uroporphyrin-III C-methyltransferase/precorrin-2 dehydrogenase/sirohydrochlorin ferrochelatase
MGLALDGRKVVVVGGGSVAQRKVRGMIDDGARVTVVSPSLTERLAAWAAEGQVEWIDRGYETGDLTGAWLVLALTDAPAVQEAVAADAEAQQTFCVVGGSPDRSTAHTSAVVRHGDLTVGVNAGGKPRLARDTARFVRLALSARSESPPRAAREDAQGRVALVGGGPGHTGLLTVEAIRELAAADVVVADRLGARGILDDLPEHVRVIEVGKAPGSHTATQERINDILAEEALAGQRVVRLKGGDPYVFGRGGEERLHCEALGIAVTVVPGVTSAVSVPAAAGIPVTHRGVAQGFSVVTGHAAVAELPAGSDHTVVMLMGVAGLEARAAELLAAADPSQPHARTAETPVAIVERGWTEEQRLTVGTLGSIGAVARERGVKNPAVVVVGDVVRVAPDFSAGTGAKV